MACNRASSVPEGSPDVLYFGLMVMPFVPFPWEDVRSIPPKTLRTTLPVTAEALRPISVNSGKLLSS